MFCLKYVDLAFLKFRFSFGIVCLKICRNVVYVGRMLKISFPKTVTDELKHFLSVQVVQSMKRKYIDIKYTH